MTAKWGLQGHFTDYRIREIRSWNFIRWSPCDTCKSRDISLLFVIVDFSSWSVFSEHVCLKNRLISINVFYRHTDKCRLSCRWQPLRGDSVFAHYAWCRGLAAFCVASVTRFWDAAMNNRYYFNVLPHVTAKLAPCGNGHWCALHRRRSVITMWKQLAVCHQRT